MRRPCSAPGSPDGKRCGAPRIHFGGIEGVKDDCRHARGLRLIDEARAPCAQRPGPEVDEAVGGHPIAVLGHDFWQIELGGSRDVIGDTLIVNGAPLTIVGVAPAGFEGTYETLGIPLLAGRPFTDLQRRVPGATGRRGSWGSSRRRFWPPQCHCSAPSASIRWPRCAPSSRARGVGTSTRNRAGEPGTTTGSSHRVLLHAETRESAEHRGARQAVATRPCRSGYLGPIPSPDPGQRGRRGFSRGPAPIMTGAATVVARGNFERAPTGRR